MTPLELGSDIGGSIRIPAAFCGVFGHKPSEGLVPGSGHFPGNGLPNPTICIAAVGPLARSAGDLRLAMQVLAGPEDAEALGWRLALPPARATRLADVRVALMPRFEWLPLDDENQVALERLARLLRDRGVKVGEAFPAPLGDMHGYYLDYQRVDWAIEAIGVDDEERLANVTLLNGKGNPVADAVAEGMRASAEQYIRWHGRRARYQQAFADFFRDWDILLAPCAISNAFPHSDVWWAERVVQVNGRPESFLYFSAYPGVATFSGLPATAFPAGRTRDGLPIGLQAIGPYLEDETCLTFVELVERELGGFVPPPGFSAEN
jgi:amidase